LAAVPATGVKVLVIDDSNTIRRSAEIFLKQGGHTVMLAEDGFDALGKIQDLRHLDAQVGWISNLRHHQAQ
jgi:CheY-like chemotaxis protein